jgi:hypothetical protein
MARNPTAPLQVPTPPPAESVSLELPAAPKRVLQSSATLPPRSRRVKPAEVSEAVVIPAGEPAAAAPTARLPTVILPPLEGIPSGPSGKLTQAFIVEHQMVERYLAGQLSQKWTQEFERFCRDNPRFVTEQGIHHRAKAISDLLVSTGHATPSPVPVLSGSRFHRLHIGWLLLSIVVLGGSLWATITWSSSLSERLAAMTRQLENHVLPMTTSEREIRLLPSRDGVMITPAITIKSKPRAAQMLDFHIDETQSPNDTFTVTIDRIDQGRVSVISNLKKDHEGHLRIQENSAALGPGIYQLSIEGGVSEKGVSPKRFEPDSWVSFAIAPEKK